MDKDRKILDCGLEVSDEGRYAKLNDLALDAIKREQKRINQLKKEEMIRLTSRLKQLGYNLLQTAKTTNENRYVISELLRYLEDMVHKFDIFFTYNELLKEEKALKKELGEIDQAINVIDSTNPNIEAKISQIEANGLMTKRNNLVQKLTAMQHRINRQRKIVDAHVAKYEFADYIQFLDVEVDAFQKKFESLNLSPKMHYCLEAWYKLMDQEIENQVKTIGNRVLIYEDYLLKYGLVDTRHNSQEKAFNLLQLFNPNLKLHYDILDGSIFVPEDSNLKLPVNYSYSLMQKVLTVQMDNQVLTFKVKNDYTPNLFLTEIKKLNPQVQFNLTAGDDTLYCTKNINDLKLPSGFCLEKDRETGEIILTNRYVMSDKALTFRVKRKMLVEELNKMYDLSQMTYEPKITPRVKATEPIRPKPLEHPEIKTEKPAPVKEKPIPRPTPEVRKAPEVKPVINEKRQKVVRQKTVVNKKRRDYRKLMGYLKIAGTFVGATTLTIFNSLVIKPIAILSELAHKKAANLTDISRTSLNQNIAQIHELQKANHEKAKKIREEEKRTKHQVGHQFTKDDIPFQEMPHSLEAEYDLDQIIAEVNGYDLENEGLGRR